MSEREFSARDVPWAKLGTLVDDAVTMGEAMELAGLDWVVEVRPDLYPDRNGDPRVDPSKRKIVRVDTDEPLGTVSSGYEVLQYHEAFDFMDQVHPRFVAAGPLKDGKQAFIVVRAPQHARLETLDGEDPHDLYVVLRTSHDGSRAIEVNLLPLRDKCMNMLTLSNFGSGARQRWSIRHTKNLHNKMIQAQEVLDGTAAYAHEFNALAERLSGVDLSEREARVIVRASTPTHLRRPDETYIDPIMDLYRDSPFNGFQGTAWGLLNAVTEHHDHYRGGAARQPETRWIQGLDGSTTRAIERTLAALTRHRAST